MRVMVGENGGEVAAGATLDELAHIYENKLASDPMIQLMRTKTGSSQLIFIVNGKVIKAETRSQVVLQDGDEVRILHPYFGG